MKQKIDSSYTAFSKNKILATGPINEVAVKVKKYILKDKKADVAIFDDKTSEPIEINMRGSLEDLEARLQKMNSRSTKKPKINAVGRPKLGVVSREVSLLPAQWEWLSLQPDGASSAIRRLIEKAKQKESGKAEKAESQELIGKFLSRVARQLPKGNEALRAHNDGDLIKFNSLSKNWPKDVNDYIKKLSRAAGI